MGSGVGGSLATMPFQVLENLLEATPLTTDDGVLLRRMCLESGALHLILACLAALSHQDTPEVVTSLYHPVLFSSFNDFVEKSCDYIDHEYFKELVAWWHNG